MHKKIHRHIHAKKHVYMTGLIGVATFFIIISGIFAVTRGATPHTSELAFTERSILGTGAGSVIPASCESGESHGVTQTCWNGSVISICSTCPATPTVNVFFSDNPPVVNEPVIRTKAGTILE